VIVKTRPGEQVAVRAKAYQLIQRIFLAHGIRLASPTLLIEDRAAASAGLAGAGFTAAPAAAT
jgi:hypothetical protein